MNQEITTIIVEQKTLNTVPVRKSTWLAVLRDVILITVLSGFSGLALSLFWSGDANSLLWAISISNMILLPASFTMSGCFAKKCRFRHLFKVAFGVWVFSLVNVASGVATLLNWASSAPAIFISMGIGGGLSLLIVRPVAGEANRESQ